MSLSVFLLVLLLPLCWGVRLSPGDHPVRPKPGYYLCVAGAVLFVIAAIFAGFQAGHTWPAWAKEEEFQKESVLIPGMVANTGAISADGTRTADVTYTYIVNGKMYIQSVPELHGQFFIAQHLKVRYLPKEPETARIHDLGPDLPSPMPAGLGCLILGGAAIFIFQKRDEYLEIPGLETITAPVPQTEAKPSVSPTSLGSSDVMPG